MIAWICAVALQPLPHRWVYVMSNLQVAANADKVCELIVRSKKAGYNGMVIADSKLQRLAHVPDFYFTNVKKVQRAAEANGIELIPCVWPLGYASGMLSNDVNMIEALPVKDAPFVVSGGEAWPQDRGKNLLSNGDLEAGGNNRLEGLNFQDGAGTMSFFDPAEKHQGRQSVRLENFKGANARIVWTLKTQPYHQYVLSAWSKREGLKGYVQAMALDAKGRNLVVSEMSQSSDEPWTQVRQSFNSLDNTSVNIYVGVWGGSAGKMWWDDVSVEDAGLLNVVRRPGTPVTVTTASGTALKEGVDFAPIADPGLGQKPWPGEYDVNHPAPAIKLLKPMEGQRLKVSYYHAKTGYGNQASICLSEPKTQELMRDEARRVIELFKPKGLFWSHDEMRIACWCAACQGKGTPGQMLARNARACAEIQEKLAPGSTVYVWNDMFDPAHNAVKDYYLTNGTLEGSWEGLPKGAVIVNWHSGQAAKSLPFFAGRGHRQILAGYYDAPVDRIKPWLAEAKKHPGLAGVMYTTWVGDYSNLESFAKAAWGG